MNYKNFEIIKTDNIGFCFGVRRAVEAIFNKTENNITNKKIYTLGQIIHNNIINDKLKSGGVLITEDIDEIENGSIVFIRTHGVPKSVLDRLKTKNAEIYDQTCPKVKKIQTIASESENLIIAGDKTHPEIIGIAGNAKNKYFIVKDIDELKKIMHNIGDMQKEYIFVAQTTFNIDKFAEMESYLKAFANVKVINTICTATYERQREVEKLSGEVDAMVIVGGKNSSNTKKLYQIASRNCVSFHIENPDELP